MTNQGISGTVLDTGSPPAPIAGLIAAAYYVDPIGLFDDRELARAETTATGSFSLVYDIFDFNPNLRVRVFDPVQRLPDLRPDPKPIGRACLLPGSGV